MSHHHELMQVATVILSQMKRYTEADKMICYKVMHSEWELKKKKSLLWLKGGAEKYQGKF